MGYFCSISIYKVHLERPGGCALLGCCVMSAAMTAASSKREEMCLQFLWLLEFSSSFPTHVLPTLGSMNSVHSETIINT